MRASLNLRNLFLLNCAIALSYGLTALISPNSVMAVYGLTLNPAGELVTRFYAAELIAHGWMTWRVRNAASSPTRLAIISSRSVGNAIRAVLSVVFFASGEADARGLMVVGIFGFLSVAYAYFWITEPAE